MSWFPATGVLISLSVALSSTKEKQCDYLKLVWRVNLEALFSISSVCVTVNSRKGMYGTVVACVRQHLSTTGEGDDQVFIQRTGR